MEEKGGDSFGGDGFLSGAENYPLSKAMVYHDQKGIKARGGGKVGDQIAGDLLERAGGGGFDWSERRDGGVCIGFVLLADCASFDVFSDVRSKAGPPEFTSD